MFVVQYPGLAICRQQDSKIVRHKHTLTSRATDAGRAQCTLLRGFSRRDLSTLLHSQIILLCRATLLPSQPDSQSLRLGKDQPGLAAWPLPREAFWRPAIPGGRAAQEARLPGWTPSPLRQKSLFRLDSDAKVWQQLHSHSWVKSSTSCWHCCRRLPGNDSRAPSLISNCIQSLNED